jgi:alpha-mannosidase
MNNSSLKFLVVSFCTGLILSFAAQAEAAIAYTDAIAKLKQETSGFKDSINNWNYREKCSEECFSPSFDKELKWKKAAPGFYWSEPNQVFWFVKTYTVPETVSGVPVAGSKITLTMNVSDGGDVYTNGVRVGDEGGAAIVEKAVPGEKILIGVRVHNGTWPGAYLGSELRFSVFDEPTAQINKYLERILCADALVGFSKDRELWVGKLNESAAKIDFAALARRDFPAFHASLDAAENVMSTFGGFFKDYTIYMLSYSHIDLAWLWDYAEGELVVRDTMKTVFGLMNEYPGWIYAQSQAHSFKWMEDDYPDIFAEAQKRFKEGRLEIVGGTWAEHDSNLTGGEGLVRQFLYGKRYFRKKFGKDIVVAWTPDSFGYNWNLPQILVKSGMTGFVTQKLGSNEVTRFPYKIFWWKGADGSKILTYFPPSGYAGSVDRLSTVQMLAGVKSSHGVNDDLNIYGVGDHGGGLTRGHLDRLFELKNDPAYPKVVFSTAENYFNHLRDLSKTFDFPVWNDELYLEHHRGTYTSQANNKKNNRAAEIALENAEKFSVVANVDFGLPYPADRIFMPGWYFTLLFHMHDILPGSGIRKVYEDCDRDYAKVFAATNGIINEALGKIAANVNTNGAGEPLLIFNPVSWDRDALVETPFNGLTENAQVLDDKGIPVPCQLTQKDGTQNVLFIARGLPALGYAVYRVFPAGDAHPKTQAPASDLSLGDGTIENSIVRISYDPASGEMTSLFDKKLNREILTPGTKSNMIQAFVDTQNAWEIMANQPIDVTTQAAPRVVENGPVRITIQFEKKVGNSTYIQNVSVYERYPIPTGLIDVDNNNHNVTVKLAFNLNMSNEDAWFEIPYAAISRKAIPKTQAEKAKYEVSAHKWVDYTNADGAAGFSLLNNSKYGFDVKENVLRMTLLRSPTYPDPMADIGKHSIEYAIYPHAGDWRAADTSRRAYEFNYRPYVLAPGKHAGTLPASKSWFRGAPDDVALTVVKMGEDDGVVIRFVETEGRTANAEIELPWAPVKIAETNLIEDEIAPAAQLSLNGNKITVPIGPFEIKTLKLTLK